ncbi:MAG: universal stress protein [Promethearchaeota archaeon]
MYKKVLLCIDGSEEAYKAVNKVIEFYKIWNCKIVAFHSIEHHMVIPVFTIFGQIPSSIESYDTVRSDYEKLGKQIIKETKLIFKKASVPIEARLIYDIKPEKYAIERVKDEIFDLIVLGSKGHHSKFDLVLGTVATYIVNNAECDVLIIR